ncbi:MAG: hypothetical protein QM820_12830 [Minicystis sp.]
MKSIMLLAGVIAMVAGIAASACTVEAGVDVGGAGGGGACENVLCGDALVSGLAVQGDALCDPVSDDAYANLFACGCGAAGACEPECGDNFCSDLGETGACGDCLSQLCGPEHQTCGNN